MKAVIICSIHALCNISQLEREACNRACELHDIPAVLAAQDHARLLATTTMLGFLAHLPGSRAQREGLVSSYLDILNEAVWATRLIPNKTVLSAILGQDKFTRRKGFVSDYPLLTTNVMRSAALLTNASRIGHLKALSDPLRLETTSDALTACASFMGITHSETEVLVAHKRDFIAAKSLGMSPRFIEGLRPQMSSRSNGYAPTIEISSAPIINNAPLSQISAAPN